MMRGENRDTAVRHDRERKDIVVFIASEAVLTAWSARGARTEEVIGVSDADGCDPLEVITRRQPQIVVLEEGFAGNERGAALVGRLRTDRAFQHIDIRVLSSERAAQIRQHGTIMSLAALAQPLRRSYEIARRSPRRKVSGEVKADINGSPVTVVDLSASGAQVISAVILHPQQRIQVVLADSGPIQAEVVWVALEMAPAPRYRAGIEFRDIDTQPVYELLPPS
jgi:hypothetical protein